MSAGVIVCCPQCAQRNSPEETYCSACGAALVDAPPSLALAPLLPGSVLADTYVLESGESLGSENRYTAHRLDEASAKMHLRERREDEAEAFHALSTRTAGVSHPAIVVPERCFTHDGRAYLAVPDIAGTRLSTRIGITTEREAIAWGIQLCQVLGVLHRNGLLCMELPPDGVLLDKDGRLRLTHTESLSRRGEPLAFASVADGYAAPEVYKPGDAEESADVFAVAALLFSLLVGKRLPVEGWAVQADPLVFYPDKVVSPDFERILRQALAVDPHDRYVTIEALKTALLTLTRFPRIRSAWWTDVGQMRSHNEDAVLVKEQSQGTVAGKAFAGLYVVSDGMGGAEAGEVASVLTIHTVAAYVEKLWTAETPLTAEAREHGLRAAIAEANTAILAYARQHSEAAGLGATVVAALVHEQQLTLAWVGDSRGYLWEQGRLQQLSHDHSLVARLVEIGQLSPEAARMHEHRNVLLRSLGNKEQAAVDVLSCPLRRGARLVLCSDGLTGHVDDRALGDIVSRHRDPYDAALELVAAANAGGGSDNISVVVVFHE